MSVYYIRFDIENERIGAEPENDENSIGVSFENIPVRIIYINRLIGIFITCRQLTSF